MNRSAPGHQDFAQKNLRVDNLRVLLDARKLEDGGIGKYIQNLVYGLTRQSGLELSLLVRSGFSDSYGWGSKVDLIEDDAGCYSLDEMFLMPRRIDRAKFDLFHAPHYTLPYGLGMPSVVTIHDLIHLRYAARWYHSIFARFLISSALHRATRVIAVSQATCQDLIDMLSADSRHVSRIRVVPNAVDPLFAESRPARSAARDYVATRFHLQGPFFLSVLSNAKRHKGIEDLLEAFGLMRQALAGREGSSPRLVLVGKGTEGLVELESVLDRTGEIPGVHLLGLVSREDLCQLYAAAGALVVASYAEGFCLPVLEAQVCGTPVIARPVPAVLELLSRNDTVCRDFSTGALQDALVTFSERADHAGPGLLDTEIRAQLERFSAVNTAARVLDIYREAVHLKRGTA